MRKRLIIVPTDEVASEYTVVLEKLTDKIDYDKVCWTFKDYNKMLTLGDFHEMHFNDKFVFISCEPPEETVNLLFSKWRYDRFGCKINWKGNKCVLFARALDLPYSDYDEFRKHCEAMRYTYPDIVVPPESPLEEGFKVVKEFFGGKETNTAQRAQLSVIVHEFADKWLNDFLDSPHSGTEIERDRNSLDMLKTMESDANTVVSAAVVASIGVVAVPIPIADVGLLVGSQTVMMTTIAGVFKIKIDLSMLTSLVYAALGVSGAALIGKTVAAWLLKLIPGVGWIAGGAIKGTVAAVLTYAIGSAFVAICKDVKLGNLKEEDIVSGSGVELFKDYFKHYTTQWGAKAKTVPDVDDVETIVNKLVVTNTNNTTDDDLTSEEWLSEFKNSLSSQ